MEPAPTSPDNGQVIRMGTELGIELAFVPSEDNPAVQSAHDVATEELADPKDDPVEATVDDFPNQTPAQDDVRLAQNAAANENPDSPPRGTNPATRHWHSMVSQMHLAFETKISPEEWEVKAKPLRDIAH